MGLVSAALCVGFLTVLGILFLAWPVTLWFALAVIGIKDPASVEIVTGTAGLLLCAPALYVGLIFGRFALRAMPPRTSGRPRVVLFVVLVSIGASALLAVLYLAREMEVALAYKLIFGLSCSLWLVGLFGLVGSRHLRPRAFYGVASARAASLPADTRTAIRASANRHRGHHDVSERLDAVTLLRVFPVSQGRFVTVFLAASFGWTPRTQTLRRSGAVPLPATLERIHRQQTGPGGTDGRVVDGSGLELSAHA